VFTHSEVIVLTHKQTNQPTNRCRLKHPTFFAMLRRWVIIDPSLLVCSDVHISKISGKTDKFLLNSGNLFLGSTVCPDRVHKE